MSLHRSVSYRRFLLGFLCSLVLASAFLAQSSTQGGSETLPTYSRYCAECPEPFPLPILPGVSGLPPYELCQIALEQDCNPGGGTLGVGDSLPPVAQSGGSHNGVGCLTICWSETGGVNINVELRDGALCPAGALSDPLCHGPIEVPWVDADNDGEHYLDSDEEDESSSPFAASDPMADAWNDDDGDGFPKGLDIDDDPETGKDKNGLAPPGVLSSDPSVVKQTLRIYLLAEHGLDVGLDILPDHVQELVGDGFATDKEVFKALYEHLKTLDDPVEAHSGAVQLQGIDRFEYMEWLEPLAQAVASVGFEFVTDDQAIAELTGIERKYGLILKSMGVSLETSSGPVTLETEVSSLSTGGEPFLPHPDGTAGTSVEMISSTPGIEVGDDTEPPGGPQPVMEEGIRATASDPVNPANGEFLHKVVDLDWPGRGMNHQLVRYYQSRSIRSGILGNGWSMPILETSLRIWNLGDGTRLLELLWGDGRRSFYNQATGQDPNFPYWVGIGSAFGTIRFAVEDELDCAQDEGTALVLREPNGMQYYFCPPVVMPGVGGGLVSYLAKYSDAYGNAVTLQRGPNGLAHTLIDSVGNELQFEYNDAFRLTKITDWVGREYSYSYELLSGALKQVDYPETTHLSGGVLTQGAPFEAYTYAQSAAETPPNLDPVLSYNLASIATSSVTPHVTLTYDDFDMVTEVNVGGDLTHFLYQAIAEGADPIFSSATQKTRVLHGDGVVEDFYFGEGLLYGHAVNNGLYDLQFTKLAGTQQPGLAERWLTIYEYDEDNFLITQVLHTTDADWPNGRRAVRFYDNVSAFRAQHRNLVVVMESPWPSVTGQDLLTTLVEYEPVTNRPVRITNPAGEVTIIDYGHQERSYAANLADSHLSPWPILPSQPVNPTLWGLGDLNEDGIVGGGYAPVRHSTPPLEQSNPGGPGAGSTVASETSIRQYDDLGQMVATRSGDGVWEAYEYQFGLPKRLTLDPGGLDAVYSFDYDSVGDLVSQVDPDGYVTNYLYDQRGLLVEVSWESHHPEGGFDEAPDGYAAGFDPRTGTLDGIHSRYYYDLNGHLVGMTPRRLGGAQYFGDVQPQLSDERQRDATGQVTVHTTRSWDDAGAIINEETLTNTYDGRDRLKSSTSSSGVIVTLTRDPRGMVTGVTRHDPYDGATYQSGVQYDDYGQSVLVTSPVDADGSGSNDASVVERDGFGRVASVLSPGGHKTTYNYDLLHRTVLWEIKEGGTTLHREGLTYDALGRIRERAVDYYEHLPGGTVVHHPDKSTTLSWGYSAGSRLQWERVEARGVSSYKRALFDGAGRQVGVRIGAGTAPGLDFSYTPGGRLQSRALLMDDRAAAGPVSPSTPTTSYERDVFGFVNRVTDGAGGITTFVNGPLGVPSDMTSPDGQRMLLSHDSDGNLLQRTSIGVDGKQRSRTYTYDGFGHVQRVDGPLNHFRQFEHDGFGRMRKRWVGEPSADEYGYDGYGRVLSLNRPGGVSINLSYEAGGELASLLATGADAAVSRTYESSVTGRLLRLTESVDGRVPTVIERAYSGTGELLSDKLVAGARVAEFGYMYSGPGRLDTLTYPSGRSISWSYDSIGRINGIDSSAIGPLASVTESYGMGGVRRASLGSAVLEREYDGLGRTLQDRVLTSAGVILGGYTQSYTPGGNLLTRSSLHEGSSETFTFDGHDRLEDWSKTIPGITRTVSYATDAFDNIEQVDDSIFGVIDIALNGLDQATSITPGADGLQYGPVGEEQERTLGNERLAWQWDALGRAYRCDQYETVEGQELLVGAVEWTHDGLDRLIERVGSAGVTQYDYVGEKPVCVNAGGVLTEYLLGFSLEECLATYTSQAGAPNTWEYVHVDAFGNHAFSHNGSSLLSAVAFDPFGTPRNPLTGGILDSADASRLLFLGRPYDSELGLGYLGARFLETETGRFLERDPLGMSDTQSLYSYAGGNPFRYSDPTGLIAQETGLPEARGVMPESGHVEKENIYLGGKEDDEEKDAGASLEDALDTFIDNNADSLGLNRHVAYSDLSVGDKDKVLVAAYDDTMDRIWRPSDMQPWERKALWRGALLLRVQRAGLAAEAVVKAPEMTASAVGGVIEEATDGAITQEQVETVGTVAELAVGGYGAFKSFVALGLLRAGVRIIDDVPDGYRGARNAARAGARTSPRNLGEQLALDEAKGGAGERIMKSTIKDPNYPKDVWAKMQHVREHPGGGKSVIHYWENLQTGAREGFKFK